MIPMLYYYRSNNRILTYHTSASSVIFKYLCPENYSATNSRIMWKKWPLATWQVKNQTIFQAFAEFTTVFTVPWQNPLLKQMRLTKLGQKSSRGVHEVSFLTPSLGDDSSPTYKPCSTAIFFRQHPKFSHPRAIMPPRTSATFESSPRARLFQGRSRDERAGDNAVRADEPPIIASISLAHAGTQQSYLARFFGFFVLPPFVCAHGQLAAACFRHKACEIESHGW